VDGDGVSMCRMGGEAAPGSRGVRAQDGQESNIGEPCGAEHTASHDLISQPQDFSEAC